jgi:hypothetical protein
MLTLRCAPGAGPSRRCLRFALTTVIEPHEVSEKLRVQTIVVDLGKEAA